MKKLLLTPIMVIALFASCNNKFDKSQFVGTWEHNEVINEEYKTLGSVTTAMVSRESFKVDGTCAEDLKITGNGTSMFGDMHREGTWKIEDDSLKIHYTSQTILRGTKDVDEHYNRKIISVDNIALTMSRYVPDENKNDTIILRRIR